MESSVIKPEWLRVEHAADYSGLSRTELFHLSVTGEVESIHKIRPGKQKGIRLINRASLDAYIRSFLPGGSRYQAPIAPKEQDKEVVA